MVCAVTLALLLPIAAGADDAEADLPAPSADAFLRTVAGIQAVRV
jgi:hypothetical protein